MASKFKAIDEKIFGLIDQFKTSGAYSKFMDGLASIDEEYRSLINELIILILLVFSFLPLLIGYILKSDAQKILQSNTKLAQELNTIIQSKNENALLKRSIIGNTPISAQSDFQRQISTAASTAGISSSTVKVENFNQSTISSDIDQVTAVINFEGLSTMALMNFWSTLTKSMKMVIGDHQINRNGTNQKISGSFNITYYGPVVNE